jgi:hypothetical protein
MPRDGYASSLKADTRFPDRHRTTSAPNSPWAWSNVDPRRHMGHAGAQPLRRVARLREDHAVLKHENDTAFGDAARQLRHILLD